MLGLMGMSLMADDAAFRADMNLGSDFSGNPIYSTGTKTYSKTQLTKKQQKARAAAKRQRKSRKINR